MPAPRTMHTTLSDSRSIRALFLALSLCLTTAAIAQAPPPQDTYAAGQDPPNRVARISIAQGNVSLESSGTNYFTPAEVNYPLTSGDRLYCDVNSVSELQSAGLAVRMGNAADFTITQLTDSAAQFALAQGSIRLRIRDLYAPPDPYGNPQVALDEVDTLNSTVIVTQPGDIRVDAYPQDGSSVVTVTSGQAQVSGPGFNITLGPGQALRMLGIGQVYPEYVGLLPPDQLDQFDITREQIRDNSFAIRNHFVDPDMIGVADLDQYGDWNPTPQYGPVWFPRNVASGWSPYSIGHWANIYPWGYTWVDSQPWGFAPFHYGRWNNFGGRWGWVPGPPPSLFRSPAWGGPPPRPVYSPALVAFVGGASFSVSIGGVGVTAWFPLGPSEPYVPWYHTSPAYVNRVNVTNVYNTNVTEIHNTYITKNVTVYNVTNVTYVNRTTATVVVNQKDFAAGHTVAHSTPVNLPPAALKAQLVSQPVLTHAAPPPPKAPIPPPAPAKAVPANVERPVVQTKQGFQRAGAPPAAAPLKAPAPQPAKAGSAVPQPPPPRPALAPAKTSTPVTRPATAPPAAPAAVARPVIEAPSKPAAPPAKPMPAPVVRSTPEPPARPAPEAPTKPAIQPGVKPANVPLARPAPEPRPLIAPKPVPPVAPPPAARPAPPAPDRKVPPARDDKNKPKDEKPKDEKPS